MSKYLPKVNICLLSGSKHILWQDLAVGPPWKESINTLYLQGWKLQGQGLCVFNIFNILWWWNFDWYTGESKLCSLFVTNHFLRGVKLRGLNFGILFCKQHYCTMSWWERSRDLAGKERTSRPGALCAIWGLCGEELELLSPVTCVLQNLSQSHRESTNSKFTSTLTFDYELSQFGYLN